MKKVTNEPAIEKGLGAETAVCELFVFGHDEQERPHGGRFLVATDDLIQNAKDHNYHMVIKPPLGFTKLAMELPMGRAFSSGKVVLPSIRQSMHAALVGAEKLIPQYRDADVAGIPVEHFNNEDGIPDIGVIDPLPIYPKLPSDWKAVDVGDLVLITAGSEYGWWEAVVIGRVEEILILRLRDEPKQGTFIRHRLGVGLINPGAPAP